MATIDELQAAVRSFSEERDWAQFHTPKNLVMALAGEVGELSEIFQWLTPDEANTLDHAAAARAEEEIADVLIYLLRLADVLGIDLSSAVSAKLAVNAEKYPVELARGRAVKYTELRSTQ